METELENSLPTKKINNMQDKPAINMFTINLPVNDHLIRVVLCLFCGDPSRNNKGKFSYSIVGRVTGINCNTALVEIMSDYGRADKLKDQLLIINNQFIYSNQSTLPAILDIAIRLKGLLPWGEIIDACFNIKLRYTLQHLIINGIKSEYTLKNMSKSRVLLLQ
jgi:hypothetical protein